jgi:hypothetical protein
MKRRILLLASVVLLALFVPAEAWAQGCAMCKAAVESAEPDQAVFGGQQSIGRGLNVGILFLIPVPYILLFLLFRKKIMGFVKEFANAQG